MKNYIVEEKDNTLSKTGESFIVNVGCYPETNIA